MLEFVKAMETDALELTRVAIRAFDDDKTKYGSYPPGIDTESQHLTYMKEADYFKILNDGVTIGGVIVFNDQEGNYILGSIFIEPSFQNQGIGQKTISFIERTFSDAKKWSLDTPCKSYRNHHLYEKMGYVKKGEMHPDVNSDFRLFIYEKKV